MSLRNVCTFLRHAEAVHTLPSHPALYDGWREDILDFMQDGGIEDSPMVQAVLEFREDMLQQSLGKDQPSSTPASSLAHSVASADAHSVAHPVASPPAKPWEWLLSVAATGQRTTEWYAEAKRILTASEISAIWKGPRSRAALVLSKVPKEETPFTRRLAVYRADTSPMDWGVRYEPVVKEILENSLGIVIYELGRIHHRTVKGIAASPDGLITEAPVGSPLLGTLVEIKCPTSRVITNAIPFDYWCQMQLQMEVCGIDSCEFVETKFKEVGADEAITEGATNGWITLEANSDTMEMKYVYHSAPASSPSSPPEGSGGSGGSEGSPWISMETYRWELVQLRRVTVPRDQEWFAKIQPDIASFWKDVQGACDGTWIAPPSTRKPKVVAQPVCAIQDSGPEA